MDKRKLNSVFKKIKENAKMDYAVVNADEYGDCNSCVNDGLADEFGLYSTGIYAKYWRYGGNKCRTPFKDLDELYISHDITEEQAEILVKTFKENGYNITPEKYDASKSFKISEG